MHKHYFSGENHMNESLTKIICNASATGLTALVLACGGGGSSSTSVPVPQDVIDTRLESGSYKLTNVSSGISASQPGKTVDFMTGDNVEYQSENPFTTSVYKNGEKDTTGAYGTPIIDKLTYDAGWTAYTGANKVDVAGNGSQTLTFDQTYLINPDATTTEIITPLTVKVEARGAPAISASQYTSYNFTTQGPTMRLKPAVTKTYNVQLTTQQIDDLSTACANGKDLSDNHQITYQEMHDFLIANQSIIQSYVVDFPSNTFGMRISTGGAAGVSFTSTSTPRKFEYQTDLIINPQ